MSEHNSIDQYKIEVGQRIWRPVDFSCPKGMAMGEAAKHGKLVKTVREFEMAELTDRGTYVMRASRAQCHQNKDALWAYAPKTEINGKLVVRMGLVCFLKSQLQPDWTWLVVTSLTKRGNALFAHPVSGNLDELLSQYALPEGI